MSYTNLSDYDMKSKRHAIKKIQNGQSSYASHIRLEGGKDFTDNKKTTGYDGPRWAEQKRNTWFAIAMSSGATT